MIPNIGKRIVTLREARGWTQIELARKAEVGQGYLSMVEAGERSNPSVYFAAKLAAALEISIDALIADEQPAEAARVAV